MANQDRDKLGDILNRLENIEKIIQGEFSSPWMTAREAARFLRCSVTQINRLVSAGLLPYSRQDPTAPKSPRLFHRKDLTAYLVTGRNPERKPLSQTEKRMVEELL